MDNLNVNILCEKIWHALKKHSGRGNEKVHVLKLQLFGISLEIITSKRRLIHSLHAHYLAAG